MQQVRRAIKRITETLNPRICRVVALGVPTEKNRLNGSFNVMLLICRQPEKWSCLIVVGITGPVLKELWDLYG